MREVIRNTFLECLALSTNEDKQFIPGMFFDKWFRSAGKSFLFLFKKNLNVTNLQMVELLSLLRCNTRFSYSHAGGTINGSTFQFMSSAEFRVGLSKVFEGFSKGSNSLDFITFLADYMFPLASSTIICDIYFGSCLIFLPPGIECDLARICAQSGYVHSCGPNLLFRNITKVNKEFLCDKIRAFLASRHRDTDAKPIRMVIYAHEDFTKYDRPKAADLRNGLDDVKVYLEKYYLGTQRLVEVLRLLEAQFDQHLHIMGPGPFQDRNEQALSKCDPTSSLWLLVDHGTSDVPRHRGDDQYLICYEQQYKNETPLHIFDENKPAWIDHTTIPHTLMGSMLNITAPWWPKNKPPVIGDPFAGTGTTWLEAAKCGVMAECSDLLPIADQLCRDNARFFCLSIKELKSLSKDLKEAEDVGLSAFVVPNEYQTRPSRPHMAKKWLLSIQAELGKQSPGEVLSKEVERKLREEDDILYRMLFYIGLRTGRRHVASFIRQSEDWEGAYKLESAELRAQINDLSDLYKSMNDSTRVSGEVQQFIGQYSYGVCLPIVDWLLEHRPAPVRGGIDVRSFPKESCDVIITDPPYGFNADMQPKDLAELFQATIGVVLDALKENGQLVIALPDWSHTGKELPFFVLKEMFTQQLILAVSDRNMEIIGINYSLPPPSSLLRPPYYWESARALRRAILHFRFRRLEDTKTGKQHIKNDAEAVFPSETK